MAVQAYVLIQTDVGKSAQVAEEVGEIEGVIAAHNVTGNYDVIVLAEAESMDDLAARRQPDPAHPRHHPHHHLLRGPPVGGASSGGRPGGPGCRGP